MPKKMFLECSFYAQKQHPKRREYEKNILYFSDYFAGIPVLLECLCPGTG
jgi:hypothetical protein